MKKFVLILVTAFLLVLSSYRLTLAEDSEDVDLIPTITVSDSRHKELREEIEEKREEVKEKIELKKEELKKKLEKFKDGHKAQTAARISENLNKLNDKKVEIMTEHVEKMEKLLERVRQKTAEAKANGKDVTKIEESIAAAQSEIDKVRIALTAQSAKDYTLTATDETLIKEEAKKNRSQLQKDLKAVHDLVVSARKAVSDAVSITYSTLGKEDVDKEEEDE
jgi:chromosome segregation ATPase